MLCVYCLMIRRPPRSTRTDTLFPYTTRFRSGGVAVAGVRGGDHGLADVPGLVAAGDLEPGQGEQRARAGTALERARGVGDGLQVLRHGELGLVHQAADRAEARRGGTVWVSTCRSRGSPSHYQQKKNKPQQSKQNS